MNNYWIIQQQCLYTIQKIEITLSQFSTHTEFISNLGDMTDAPASGATTYSCLRFHISRETYEAAMTFEFVHAGNE